MNTDSLFQYIANHINSYVQILDEKQNTVHVFQCVTVIFSFFEHSPEAISFFATDLYEQVPTISSVNQDFVYASIPLKDQTILVGPVRIYSQMSVKRNLHVDLGTDFRNLSIPSCEFSEFISCILLLHNFFHSSPISSAQLIDANFSDHSNEDVEKYYSELLFNNREEGMHHNAYSKELRMLTCIETGDVEMLKRTFKDEDQSGFGKLANSTDRNFRDIGISVITLISRAAIHGGVNPELAFSLCDSYVMKIENLVVLDGMKSLIEDAKLRFATMVAELKSTQPALSNTKRHPLLEQSKDYIYSHLHSKITMQEVASAINISSNYLSELFRKYEGISFTDFVMREKISLVKNMLVYSPYSYIEIATYLGFSSQSHLGKQFKVVTGMTLKQYRDMHSSTEFRSKKMYI